MKKYFSLTILLFLCLPFAAYSLEVPKLQGYINDYAEMISPAAKSKLEETLRAFEQSDSTQIVILTVPSLEGENIEDFGIKVGEAWKIGQKGKDNGAILIVSKQERKIRIEVGYGLEGRLTDLTAGRIIDLVIKPKFKQEDFDGGFIAGVSSLIDATRGEFRVERRPQRSISPFLSIFLFLAIFTLIMGSISRALGGVIGAIGLPILVRLFASVGGITVFILLAVFGFGAGFLLPSLFSSRGSGGASRKDGDRHHRGGGFFYGPGTGGFFSGGGGFGGGGGGGFSGGGGSFGGGGASGDW
ncbi:MAG TPA: TPM domain-containing protein [Thermodesulfobacteriota bacterium]|nr:TPM domain-containing protein [Thermodesulfobacteriota bacterium]